MLFLGTIGRQDAFRGTVVGLMLLGLKTGLGCGILELFVSDGQVCRMAVLKNAQLQ